MGASKTGYTLGAREVFELVQPELEQVEAQIARETASEVTAITGISRYLQASGGKRLRPTLLLLSAKLCGPVTREAIELAAVVEMIHTATLVHDDVIDVAETRRGRPSTNVIWGNHTCVLAGDWIYMQAFRIALRQRDFRILDILINLTQQMVEGELLQLERLRKIDISEAEYFDLVDRKTASLFSACAQLGALVSGATEMVQSQLARYAWNLGMAFQLVDDILDFIADQEVLGKPVGSDLREGKVTLPLICALRTASEDERALIASIVSDGEYTRVAWADVLELLHRRGGIEQAFEQARQFADQARAIIQTFPDSAIQRALASLPDLVVERDR